MDANGVNMVAIGLEQLGAQEFVEGAFFDGGKYGLLVCMHCVGGWLCLCDYSKFVVYV